MEEGSDKLKEEYVGSVAYTLSLFGININITYSMIIQWVIIIALGVVSYLLTRNLKKKPDGKQSVLEIFYETVENLVGGNMGEEYKGFVPFIGSIMVFLIIMNLVPLIGVPAPTEDLSVTVGMAVITFLVIQSYAIYKLGLKGYFLGYFHPLAVIFPLNIIERFMLMLSLSLRLFGNIAAGAVILDMVYNGLGAVSPLLKLGIPIPIHLYFDLFDGVIQMLIFTMLTMVHIKIVSEH